MATWPEVIHFNLMKMNNVHDWFTNKLAMYLDARQKIDYYCFSVLFRGGPVILH